MTDNPEMPDELYVIFSEYRGYYIGSPHETEPGEEVRYIHADLVERKTNDR